MVKITRFNDGKIILEATENLKKKYSKVKDIGKIFGIEEFDDGLHFEEIYNFPYIIDDDTDLVYDSPALTFEAIIKKLLKNEKIILTPNSKQTSKVLLKTLKIETYKKINH